MHNCESIRAVLAERLHTNDFVTDKSGVKCIEIVNASFIADEPTLFGVVTEYAERELKWYQSCSLNVNDIPAPVPQIWQNVATKDGLINSNYGWCIWSEDNYDQYTKCLNELIVNKDSRRACMIYIRPSMQYDYNKDGMSDFMCTYSTQILIRDNKLHYIVNMRSNDAIMGLKNDKYWHDHVHKILLNDLADVYPELKLGNMYWNAGSLHVYQRHFFLVDHFDKTGEVHISKADYESLYGKERLNLMT